MIHFSTINANVLWIQEEQVIQASPKLWWGRERQSQYIEALILGFPTLPFYVEEIGDKWTFFDGLQRFATLRQFCLSESFSLTGLKMLQDLEGLHYSELPRPEKRRLEEATLTFHVLFNATDVDRQYVYEALRR